MPTAQTTNDAMTKYPEHAKLENLNGPNDRIGEFIEWMQDEKRWTITEWLESGNNGEPRFRWKDGVTKRKLFGGHAIAPSDVPESKDEYNGDAEPNPDYASWPSGYVPIRQSIPAILADFFDIDQGKLEEEKQAMLDEIRATRC